MAGRRDSVSLPDGGPDAIPTLGCTRIAPDHVPPCLSNGVVGISPGPNPLLPARTLVNGFVSSHPLYGFENIAPAPYPLGMEITCGGRRMRADPSSLEFVEQTLTMETGELRTRMRFIPASGESIELEVIQFASRSVPCLLCQELRLATGRDTEVEVTTVIDTDGIDGRIYTVNTDAYTRGWYAEDPVDRSLGFATNRGRLGIATIVTHGPEVRRKAPGTYAVRLQARQPAVLRLIAALVPGVHSPDPHLEAIRLARWGEMLGFDTLRQDNVHAWAELWRSRIVVLGNPDDQRALDAAFYYYHCSIHPSTWAGIPPFGLAHHDKYFGHNFWDMDMWMLIPALLTAPSAARAIMSYRLRGLPAATRKAELFGYRGAQFPWEASIDGWEATPSCCPTGWAEQHVTPGVAIGVWEYQRACGDAESLRALAWPVLRAVAEWIESRGHFTGRGFEIGHMMGPDEGITNLSNQTYFNLLSRMAIDAAIRCCGQLGLTPPSTWRRIRDLMVIPRDRRTGVVLPFDRDGAAKVLTTAPPSLDTYSVGNLPFLFLHGLPVDERAFRATWMEEEKIRLARISKGGVPGAADIPGFTTGPFAVCAAHFGDRDKAAELFSAAWKPFWMAPFGMTRESHSHTWGGFVTNNGSLLQSALLGFTGLRILRGVQARYPAALPRGWDGITVERIWSRGRPFRLSARHGRKTVLRPAGP
jgi:protein-glucosylgalactosylhydroxylysine glucosidase